MKALFYMNTAYTAFVKIPPYEKLFPAQKEPLKPQTPEEMMAVMAGLS